MMFSANGVIPAGVVLFNPFQGRAIQQGQRSTKHTLTLPLQKCPDKSATIKFQYWYQQIGSGEVGAKLEQTRNERKQQRLQQMQAQNKKQKNFILNSISSKQPQLQSHKQSSSSSAYQQQKHLKLLLPTQSQSSQTQKDEIVNLYDGNHKIDISPSKQHHISNKDSQQNYSRVQGRGYSNNLTPRKTIPFTGKDNKVTNRIKTQISPVCLDGVDNVGNNAYFNDEGHRHGLNIDTGRSRQQSIKQHSRRHYNNVAGSSGDGDRFIRGQQNGNVDVDADDDDCYQLPLQPHQSLLPLQSQSKFLNSNTNTTPFLKQIARLKGQIKSLQMQDRWEQLVRVKNQNQGLQRQLEKYKQKCRFLQKRDRESSIAIKEQRDEMQRFKAKLANSQMMKHEAENLLYQKQKKLKQALAESKKAQEKVSDLNIALSTCQKRIQFREASLQQQLSKLSEKHNLSQTERQCTTQQYNNLLTKMQETQKKNQQACKQRERAHNQQKCKLNKKADQLCQELQRLKQLQEEKQSDYRQLQVSFKILQKKQAQQGQKLREYENQLEFAKCQLEKQAIERQKLKNQLEIGVRVEEERNALKKKNSQTFAELNRLKDSCEMLKKERALSADKEKEHEQAISHLKSQRSQFQSTINLQRKEIQQLKKLGDKKSRQGQHMSAQVSNHTQRINDLKSRLQSDQRDFSEMQRRFQQQSIYLTKSKEYLEAQVQDLKWTHERQKEQYSKLEGKFRENTEEMLELNRQLLQAADNSRRLQEELRQAKTNFKGLVSQNLASTERQKSLSEQLKIKSAQNYDQSRKLLQLEQQVILLQQNMKHTQSQSTQQSITEQKTLHSKDKRIQYLQQANNKLAIQVIHLKQEVESLTQSLSLKAVQATRLKDNSLMYQGQLSDLEQKCQQIREELRMTKRENTRLEAQMVRISLELQEKLQLNSKLVGQSQSYKEGVCRVLEKLNGEMASSSTFASSSSQIFMMDQKVNGQRNNQQQDKEQLPLSADSFRSLSSSAVRTSANRQMSASALKLHHQNHHQHAHVQHDDLLPINALQTDIIIKKHNSVVASYRQQLNEIAKQLQSKNHRITQLKQKLQEQQCQVQSTLTKQKQRIRSIIAESAKQRGTLNEQLYKCKESSLILSSQKQKLSNRVKQLEQINKESMQQIAELQAQKNELRAQTKQLGQQLLQIKSSKQVKGISGNDILLTNRLSQSSSSLNATEQQQLVYAVKQQYQKKYAQLEYTIKTKGSTIKKLQAQLVELKLQQTYNKQREQQRELHRQQVEEQHEQQLKQLNQKLSKMTDQKRVNQRKIKQLQNDFNQQKEQFQQVSDTLTRQQSKLQKMKAKNNQLNETLAEREQENARLKQKNQQSKKIIIQKQIQGESVSNINSNHTKLQLMTTAKQQQSSRIAQQKQQTIITLQSNLQLQLFVSKGLEDTLQRIKEQLKTKTQQLQRKNHKANKLQQLYEEMKTHSMRIQQELRLAERDRGWQQEENDRFRQQLLVVERDAEARNREMAERLEEKEREVRRMRETIEGLQGRVRKEMTQRQKYSQVRQSDLSGTMSTSRFIRGNNHNTASNHHQRLLLTPRARLIRNESPSQASQSRRLSQFGVTTTVDDHLRKTILLLQQRNNELIEEIETLQNEFHFQRSQLNTSVQTLTQECAQFSKLIEEKDEIIKVMECLIKDLEKMEKDEEEINEKLKLNVEEMPGKQAEQRKHEAEREGEESKVLKQTINEGRSSQPTYDILQQNRDNDKRVATARSKLILQNKRHVEQLKLRSQKRIKQLIQCRQLVVECDSRQQQQQKSEGQESVLNYLNKDMMMAQSEQTEEGQSKHNREHVN